MRSANWRVALGTVWLAVAAALFLRDSLFPGPQLARFRSDNLTLGAWLALLLGGWNLARWYQARSVRRQQSALRVKLPEPGQKVDRRDEYNPELDFRHPEPGRGK